MKRAFVNTLLAIGLVLLGSAAMFAQAPSVAGEWDASMNTPGGPRPLKITFKVDGDKLSGTVKRNDGELPLKGTIKGADISFDFAIQYNGHDLPLGFTGKVAGETMSGTVSFGGQAEDSWSAKRVPPPAKPKSN